MTIIETMLAKDPKGSVNLRQGVLDESSKLRSCNHGTVAQFWDAFRYPGFPASQQPAEQMNTKFKRDILAAGCSVQVQGQRLRAAKESDDTLLPSTQTGPSHQPCGATETAPCRCLRSWCRDGKQHVKLL